MAEELEKTRDKIADDFLGTMPEYMQDEFFMFLAGFRACFRASGIESVPMDAKDMLDEYIKIVATRSEQETKDGLHDA
jgi:hypothetical protein